MASVAAPGQSPSAVSRMAVTAAGASGRAGSLLTGGGHYPELGVRARGLRARLAGDILYGEALGNLEGGATHTRRSASQGMRSKAEPDTDLGKDMEGQGSAADLGYQAPERSIIPGIPQVLLLFFLSPQLEKGPSLPAG